MKILIIAGLVVAVTASYRPMGSPAYYGYAPLEPHHGPAYGPVPRASYAIPAPAYASPKAAYIEPVYEKPQPYSFGYNVDDGYGNTNHQNEEGDEHGAKRGSYGYKDAHGVYRQVDYVADGHGFRATIKTNEPGTAPADPADVKLYAKDPPVTVYAAPAYHSPSYAPYPVNSYGGHKGYGAPY